LRPAPSARARNKLKGRVVKARNDERGADDNVVRESVDILRLILAETRLKSNTSRLTGRGVRVT